MSAKKLRDCRGFVDTINELCTCGGNDRENGCDACKIYHAIGDWLTVEAPALPGKVVPLEGGGTAVLTMTTTESAPAEKRCGTCARSFGASPCGESNQDIRKTLFHCWKAKP